MRNCLLFICVYNMVFLCSYSQSPDEDILARWTFDELGSEEIVNPLDRSGVAAQETFRINSVMETLSGEKCQVSGAWFKLASGVNGKAIQLDGNSSYILSEGNKLTGISAGFSVASWIALGAYPTNWCPVADQSRATDNGYFLGIDAWGHAGFKIRAGGKWFEIQSDQRIPLRKWTYITGVYKPGEGILLFIDGEMVASSNVEERFETAISGDLLIGKHSIKRKPEGTIRPNATAAVYTFYDGLIDELVIWRKALSDKEVSSYYSKFLPVSDTPLPARSLPSGSPGPGRFGAVYTSLKYYEAWDALWRIGDYADVVVRFDESEGKFIFWRGTSYIPHWVTENGIWYDNEFNETWSELGCHEPMSDKRCEHSHVRVIENHDARVVVHWRYALVDNWYNVAWIDTLTGWGDWTDEVYTIYPDGVAVREITLHSSQIHAPHQWHEGILVMGPGQSPEQILEPGALTLANMKGETHTFSWEDGIPPEAGENGFVNVPPDANIHLVNTKSELKPFAIMSPESNPKWDIYDHELRRDVSMFPWWNHWPTAQKPSDGRYAMDSDHASHSSVSHGHWDAYTQTDESMTKIMLNGLTNQSTEQLVILAKSWSYPPELIVKNAEGIISDGYNPTERAYQLTYAATGDPAVLNIELNASEESPVVNPSFVIKNWGNKEVLLTVNGEEIKRGKDFRYGYRDTLTGTDLIVWIKAKSENPVEFIFKRDL